MLPTTLNDALEELNGSTLFRQQLGDTYVDYFIALKQAELARYKNFIEENRDDDAVNGVSQWEQDEYFDFF